MGHFTLSPLNLLFPINHYRNSQSSTTADILHLQIVAFLHIQLVARKEKKTSLHWWRSHRGSLLLQLVAGAYCCCRGYIGKREESQEEGGFQRSKLSNIATTILQVLLDQDSAFTESVS